ncbi:hypothetical protein BLS_003471 [Venturia inaequalis]|uniref:UDENN domain-containing protein n=1 Tax=Venturia inaequalis TaxID=5025 RepID=A0A8H3UR33_VENIN|nr:hypothetical protein BLS_003471 [Venturia inaequalis]
MAPRIPFDPILCVVAFHHASRGPEVETWIGVEEGTDPATENDWSLLPFMALADGAHSATEDFSYFSLRQAPKPERQASSLFGISCTRQLDSTELINRPADVTRSSVQKAVVAIIDSPQFFGQLKERLSIVTKAWFSQRDFTDITILQDFQESLAKSFKDQEDERDQFFGLSLREMIHEFKHQTLVLFKCLLLQPKMLFFGSHCERLCMMQFSLISLIPGLIRNLQDCADPALNNYEENLVMPTSLKTSERASLLSYVGLPLQIFSKGSLFGPYTPLQQLDILADDDTKSYVVGSTNSILLAQKDRYSDILINLDEDTIVISSQTLRNALQLTVPDRRWIDFLTQTVNDTWDETNPGRPKTLGYAGSEEFIRLQFEEYLLALLSSVKYRQYVEARKDDSKSLLTDVEGDPANEFGNEWIKAWMKTENYRIFNKFTDSHIFDIVEPNHPCTGGLSIEDVQRRLASQVAELHLDERFNSTREVVGKHLATGQAKVSTAFNNVWADIEAMRQAQAQRAAERKAAGESQGATNGRVAGWKAPKAPDLTHAQASVQAAGQRAGAYLSSWGSWASEKRKTGWGRSSSGGSSPTVESKPRPDSLNALASSVPEAATATQVWPEEKEASEILAVSQATSEKKVQTTKPETVSAPPLETIPKVNGSTTAASPSTDMEDVKL